MPKADPTPMDKIVNLCKRRGFVFPSAEIYGGLGGFWDWGPLGVLLKNNIKQEWWKTFVQERDDVVGIDGSIITNPKVWEASGHVKGFVDELVECKICHKRFKADSEQSLDDHLVEEVVNKFEKKKRIHQIIENAKERLNKEGKYSERKSSILMFQEIMNLNTISADEKLLSEVSEILNDPDIFQKTFLAPRKFNTMFKTNVGPVESNDNATFLRPETAQNIFANYELVRDSMRLKLPFGIAQVGKAFRNEITPGNFVFRSREFEQMELEYFVAPGTDDEWFEKWVKQCEHWFLDLGVKKTSLRLRKQSPDELAHYAKATTDIEYAFPIEKGWAELTGISNRQDFDLKQHGKYARGDEQAFATTVDAGGKDKKVPYVIEPSFGVDRAALAFMLDAYTVVAGGRTTTTESIKEEEVVLKLHPKLAPYKAAILPLSKKPPLQKIAHDIAQTLRPRWFVDYDETGSIGKRYRRQDEIGTPWCVTVDFDTLEGAKRPKGTVTVRDRDTMAQDNIAVDELVDYFRAKLA